MEYSEEVSELSKYLDDLEERLNNASQKPLTAEEYADLVDRTFHYYEDEYRR